MKNNLRLAILLISFAFLNLPNSFSQEKNNKLNPWAEMAGNGQAKMIPRKIAHLRQYRLARLDAQALEQFLNQKAEATSPKKEQVLALPSPDGTFQWYRFFETPVMHPELAKKYPGIHIYTGRGTDNKTAEVTFGISPEGGFHAMVTDSKGTYLVEKHPETATDAYISFFKKDCENQVDTRFTCLADDIENYLDKVHASDVQLRGGDCKMRTFRLALACTGEYAQFHGGTKASVLAEMNKLVARVNSLYQREHGVRMELIAQNDTLIFLNSSSDPYSNSNTGSMLNQNQTTCDQRVGSSNYDVGHVLGTGDGGIANLRVICISGNKAKGVSGLPNPEGDPFYFDYVAHEMGHQFGANHTQNNACNRVSNAAMEPGSGSTVMSYAGICSPDVQSHVDAYFHAYSLQEITGYLINGSGNTCGLTTSTGNSAPLVEAGLDKSLPISTPFVLTGMASDQEDANLAYTWEQMDPDVATMPPLASAIKGPSFRSVAPSHLPYRYFPNLDSLTSGHSNAWEVLPSVARSMRFRLTVRDNHPNAGCTNEDNLLLNFSGAAGPFRVLSPNGGGSWTIGENITITWDVANTNLSPVSCANVDILLSLDGGFTYPVTLAAAVPNSGAYSFTVPFQVTTRARVMIRCADNYFFDISDRDFSILEPLVPTFFIVPKDSSQTICNTGIASFVLDLNSVAGFREPVRISVSGLPVGVTAIFSHNPVTPTGTTVLTISNLGNLPTGKFPFTVTGAAASVTISSRFSMQVYAAEPSQTALSSPLDGAIDQPNQTTLTWAAPAGVAQYFLEVSTSPTFGRGIFFSGNTSATSKQLSNLANNTIYYWRVTAQNPCGSGAPSAIFAFRTVNPTCTRWTSNNVPININDTSPGNYTSVINVINDFSINDANLSVQIDHAWAGDLGASILSPFGKEVALFHRPGYPDSQFGCSGKNLKITFDDEAANTASELEATCNSTAPFAINGTYQPIDRLSGFDGNDAQGVWTLKVSDSAAEDGGTLVAWSLELCRVLPPPTLPSDVALQSLNLKQGETKSITRAQLEYSSSGNVPAQITFTLRTVPRFGWIRLSGFTLSVGESFTQQDILDGLLSYRHDGGTATSDSFIFDVINDEGGWQAGKVFSINILTNTLSSSATLDKRLLCHNDNNAQISVLATGGTPPLEYKLNNGPYQPGNIFNNLSQGNYTATVRDANGFTKISNSLLVESPPALTVSSTTLSSTITVTTSGGTGAVIFSLDGVNYQASNRFENLPNGAYTLYAKDANNCISTTSAIIAVNTLVVSATLRQGISCHGQLDASLEVQAGGGTPPYQYSLDNLNFQLSNFFTGLGPGSYTLTVKDQTGASRITNSVTIVDPPVLTLLASVNEADVSLVASGGTGTLLYSIDGLNFQTDNQFAGLPNGSYSAIVKDQNGCTKRVSFSISVNTLSVSLVLKKGITCFGTADAVIEALTSGGTTPYQYSLDGVVFHTSNQFTQLGPGSYAVTVRDAAGFSKITPTIQVKQPDPLSLNLTSAGYSITAAPTGGTPPYKYSLSGQPFQTNNYFFPLTNGSYIIAVADANGCTSSSIGTVSVAPLSGSVLISSPIKCSGDKNGEIRVQASGGVSPYQYKLGTGIYQTSDTFRELGAGNYQISIIDAGGYSANLSARLDEPQPLQATASVQNQILKVLAQGGASTYQYSLDGNAFQSSNEFLNIEPGISYQITVRDQNGCIKTLDFLHSVPVVTVSLRHITCAGSADGSILVTASGGVAPYLYSLDGVNFQSSSQFNSLSPGSYDNYVKDAGGFVFHPLNRSIVEPPVLKIDAIIRLDSAIATATGGTPPYQFSTNGTVFDNSTGIFSGLSAGTHTIFVRDANGCTAQVSIVISSVAFHPSSVAFILTPNPTTGWVSLSLKMATSTAPQIEVFDMAGRLVASRSVNNPGNEFSEEINLTRLQGGMYTVMVKSGQSIARQLLVIAR
jgi:subtilisin-like proprotein convertase family protein